MEEIDTLDIYIALTKLAEEKGVDPHKLLVAVSQLMRMRNAETTIASVMSGNWQVNSGAISLDDKSDPNRFEFSYLYRCA